MKFDVGRVFHYDSGKIEHKNIVDPILKLCGFVILPISSLCITLGVCRSSLFLELFGMILILSGVCFYFYQYQYFRTKDPNRLHTEAFLMEQRRIALIAKKINSLNPEDLRSLNPSNKNSFVLEKTVDEGDEE